MKNAHINTYNMTLYKVLNQEKQIHTVLGGTYTSIKQGHYYYKISELQLAVGR